MILVDEKNNNMNSCGSKLIQFFKIFTFILIRFGHPEPNIFFYNFWLRICIHNPSLNPRILLTEAAIQNLTRLSL